MSSLTLSQFIDGLHASRLLDTNRLDELARRPEAPNGDVDGVARYLEDQGWLTRFQIDEIRQGRGGELMFANYRLLEQLPAHPSGRSYKAFHPALQQVVVLRLIEPGWVLPVDNLGDYVERCRNASLVSHPNLVNILDSGFTGETPFLVYEYVDGANLTYLVTSMGALPAQLACEYIRQAALGLQAAHEKNVFHGDLSPARLLLSPIVRKLDTHNGDGQTVLLRPAPNSTIKVDSMGLVPRRPPASQVSEDDSHLLGAYQYLPPERLGSSQHDARGDVYSLGATLYFLLAGRPPYSGNSPSEVLNRVQHAEPTRIDSLRSDISGGLSDLIHRMMLKDPFVRPHSMASVAQYLQPFCQFGTPNANTNAPYAVPLATGTDTRPNALPGVMNEVAPPMGAAIHDPFFEPLPANTSDSQVYGSSGVKGEWLEEHHDMFAAQHSEPTGPAKPRPQRSRADEQAAKKKGWTWLILGLCLHCTAVLMLILYFMKIGPFDDSEPTPTKQEQKSKSKDKTKR